MSECVSERERERCIHTANYKEGKVGEWMTLNTDNNGWKEDRGKEEYKWDKRDTAMRELRKITSERRTTSKREREEQ